jgi:Spy/CpxP family protein refolding chaperone
MGKATKFMVGVAFVAAVLLMTASDAMAQRGRGGRGQGGGGFGGGGFGGPGGGGRLAILMNEDTQRDLDVVEDQVSKLRELQQDMRDDMRSAFEGLQDLSDEERREAFQKMRSKMETITADYDKKIDEVLLPAQREKLNELFLERTVRFQGVAGLSNDAVGKALGLTEEQRKALREKAEKVQEELQEKIAKLREESEEEILSVLPAEQREKVKKIAAERPRGGPGQGGGRGGRGGRNNET